MQSELFILFVEVVLHQTKIEQEIISDNTRRYDLGSEKNRSNRCFEQGLEIYRKTVRVNQKWFPDKEFQSEVGQKIMNIVSKMLKAETFFFEGRKRVPLNF